MLDKFFDEKNQPEENWEDENSVKTKEITENKPWEQVVAEKYYGRKHLGWPCDEAQELEIGSKERHEHIKYCKECKKLEIELEKKVGVERKKGYYDNPNRFD